MDGKGMPGGGHKGSLWAGNDLFLDLGVSSMQLVKIRGAEYLHTFMSVY